MADAGHGIRGRLARVRKQVQKRNGNASGLGDAIVLHDWESRRVAKSFHVFRRSFCAARWRLCRALNRDLQVR